MILGINQTSSVKVNRFEISKDNRVIYTADAPWGPIHLKEFHLMDAQGNMIYTTKYAIAQNMVSQFLPYNYLFTGDQEFERYGVVDMAGNEVGAFYLERTAILKAQICLEYFGKLIVGYRRVLGTMEYVTFYDGETVVGQLTKSNRVIADNKDNYMIHFVDGYESLEAVLAFFVIYYDYRYYNNTAEAHKGVKYVYKKNYDRNIDKYDPDFIRRNFGEDENARMDSFFEESVKKANPMNMKVFWIIFGSCWAVGIIITLIVLFATGVIWLPFIW